MRIKLIDQLYLTVYEINVKNMHETVTQTAPWNYMHQIYQVHGIFYFT